MGLVRVTPLQIVRAAAGRVNRAPAVLVGVWVATVLTALPLMLTLRSAIERHLGASLEAESVASGANRDWMLEFGEQSTGVSTTFGPSVLGFGAPLDNLSALLDGHNRPLPIVAVGVGYVLLWTFLSGGVIDRYARDRAPWSHGFFQACGGFFWPLLRLAMVSAIAYGLLFVSLRGWLLGTVYDRLTRDVNVERTAFAVRGALYGVFVLVVAACHLLFDYAKVRLVVEGRLSALGALRAAWGFLRRQWLGSLVVYAWVTTIGALVFLAYAAVAPGAGGTGASMWIGLGISQCYIIARIWTKLLFWASEVEWFQSRLAHAGYIARQQPVWPEPAEVERLISHQG